MKRIASVLVIALCAYGAEAADTIYVASGAAFENPAAVPQAVQTECDLPHKQVELLIRAARKKSIRVVSGDELPAQGKVLSLQIVRADSLGHAMGNYHAKSVAVRGALTQNGQEIGNFVGLRNSTGQAFGQFRTSCAVLELCLQKLADDIARWLHEPSKNARIGE